ncbi:SPOR domain-containing protein [Sinisalibacter lacisalsi]|uniref:Sporulation protein n=1 Tax=Sinisalibacter lacisalsi TaxID=1526570 RepID=A0ABQ1QTI5_9RHOB|nr:SPOR domain-containing protein [Sinisalibacter lacisalsi]GGD45306.1 sporulation protein [Sinisalibacter lacisalsi]
MASRFQKGFIALLGALALAACEDGEGPAFLQGGGSDGAPAASATTRTVEREVEAPEVFQVTDTGLWDGRPSLGGVWVAHPDVKDPERVIIRNDENNTFVIGVVYRPERQTPGPKIQVSSDAAEALEMLAGKPARLNVTALRREAVPEDGPADPDAETGTLTAAPAVAATTLDDPILAATAALDAAEGKPAATAAPAPSRPAAASSGGLDKPFIQIGIFSVQGNADNTAEALRRAGMVPTIKPGKMNGKDFWRVIVGPSGSTAERAALLKKIKDLGFNDAYYVTN